ncbi:GNAT family N-acetyltransferase [Halegenticoccus tardaugens]|uniref:GNAT family N-acetyltransferase n=1 Tax=Halegenticoccus tardaugens TaxID=2071624 RepID=UPI0013E9774F|nr:GNAT family N-acetyltransferase [Halegenticoccus tardaugens]
MTRTKGERGDREADDAYEVRRYAPGDRNGVLALDQIVWGRPRGADWFVWKYVDNPYVDHVPIFVAERDGEIVGARPFMAFRIRSGDRTALALQPSDTMVHPDHRRRGLFSRMTARAVDYYAERDAAFFFNFPNELSRAGYLKLGWRDAGLRTTFYRVQDPESLAPSRAGGAGRAVARLATPLARGYCLARDRRSDSSDGIAIERHADVPADLLASLYERRVPDRLHALREPRFYRWRFASPVWNRTTYVARRDGTPVAGLVARTRTTTDGVTVSQFAEIVPLVGDRDWLAALSRLFDVALAGHAASDLVAVAAGGVPRNFLVRRGFLPDDAPPLSVLKRSRCTIVARPLRDDLEEDDAWTLNGRSLVERDSWLLSFGERDTT